jgi:hypothetical protein
MTEAEWLLGANVEQMVSWLKERGSERKLRLFACACWRRLPALLTRERHSQAVTVAERYADSGASSKELAQMRSLGMGVAAGWAWRAADLALGTSLGMLYLGDSYSPASWGRPVSGGAINWRNPDLEPHRQPLAELVREIFGNPWRRHPQRTFPAALRGLAQGCYDGDHSLYPILADALADLGEDDAALHCRQPEHYRGCHVVDWLLERA